MPHLRLLYFKPNSSEIGYLLRKTNEQKCKYLLPSISCYDVFLHSNTISFTLFEEKRHLNALECAGTS